MKETVYDNTTREEEKAILDQNSFSGKRKISAFNTLKGEGRNGFSSTIADIAHQIRTQKAMLRVKYTFLFFSEINLFTRNTSTYTLWIKGIE